MGFGVTRLGSGVRYGVGFVDFVSPVRLFRSLVSPESVPPSRDKTSRWIKPYGKETLRRWYIRTKCKPLSKKVFLGERIHNFLSIFLNFFFSFSLPAPFFFFLSDLFFYPLVFVIRHSAIKRIFMVSRSSADWTARWWEGEERDVF